MENQNGLLEVKICRRCVYTVKKGEEIDLTISKNGNSPCGRCGKKYATPYSVKVRVLNVAEETEKLSHIRAEVIEMPSNWDGQGTQVFPRQRNSSLNQR